MGIVVKFIAVYTVTFVLWYLLMAWVSMANDYDFWYLDWPKIIARVLFPLIVTINIYARWKWMRD